MTLSRILPAFVILSLVSGAVAQTTRPAAAPSTRPADGAAVNDPAARELVDRVRDAYAKLDSLQLGGRISLEVDMAGERTEDSADFAAAFRAPSDLRHEISGDLLIVADDGKIHAYTPAKNRYISSDLPEQRADAEDLPDIAGKLLGAQNPSLLLAISSDAGAQLLAGAKDVKRGEDMTIDSAAHAVIEFVRGDDAIRAAIDPQSGLLRRIVIDKKKFAQKRGASDVNTMLLTIDYTTITPGAAVADDLFAWTPPAGASVAKAESDEELTSGAGEATALVGQAAPEFELTSLDGTNVSLAELKGSVVVLDFWATWCGPCVASMPHLEKLHTDLGPEGVKVFAVNLQEPKDKVEAFMKQKNLTMPVLLDATGAVGKKYKANAIPETVVIGKDGIVKKVFIGFGGPEPLRQAVEKATNEN